MHSEFLKKFRANVRAITGAHTRLFDASGGRFAARSAAEIPTADYHVARLHVFREIGVYPLHRVSGQFLIRQARVFRRHDVARIHVVAEHPGAALYRLRLVPHRMNSLGSATLPLIALAATVAAEARYIDASRLPMRPL